MCIFDPKNDGRHLDPCLEALISALNAKGIETLACCCGHGVYPMTVIYRDPYSSKVRELFSGATIARKRRFYRKDLNGMYYVPEVIS